jgi:hypothetical protein
MKSGTHNLGRNARGQLALARVDKDDVVIQLGSVRVTLSREQAQLLKDVLS